MSYIDYNDEKSYCFVPRAPKSDMYMYLKNTTGILRGGGGGGGGGGLMSIPIIAGTDCALSPIYGG